MKRYIITIIILLVIILLFLGGYFIYSNAKTNESNSVDTLKAKCISEIEFLSSDIVSMMNQINNITYSNFKITSEKIKISTESQTDSSDTANISNGENNQSSNNTVNSSKMESSGILTTDKEKTNWKILKNKIEIMYSTWTTVMMDLSILNVNKDNLTKFNNILDSITKDFEKEEKSSSLLHLADLHNLLTLYLKDFSEDSQNISLYIVKTFVLYSYAYCEQDNWAKTTEYIKNAKQEFSNVLNNPIHNANDIDIINKSYILINELEKNSNNNDKDIFYINYSNLMQELENISNNKHN